MRAHLVGVGAGATYERYEEAYTEQTSIKEKLEQEKIIRNLEQAGLLLTLILPNPATNPVCLQMDALIGQKKADLQRLVRNVYITQLQVKFYTNDLGSPNQLTSGCVRSRIHCARWTIHKICRGSNE